MEYKPQSKKFHPRLIIHGGAGNITPDNLPLERYNEYHTALLTILSAAHRFLVSGHDALDTVTYAVELLENNPLFNSGKGAVFTRDGINELEASIMVSRGKKKRGVGLMGLRHVKNPIKLAREMLILGERDIEGGNGEHRGPMTMDVPSKTQNDRQSYSGSSGAQGHSQLHGAGAEKLAREWGLEIVDESYFFTQNRWDEHIKGLERERDGIGSATWDGEMYVSQGTCGAVALDSDGVCAVATSTGGMTNKLTGRIGDTPTLGAGFWAEEWEEIVRDEAEQHDGPLLILSETIKGLMADCLRDPTIYTPLATTDLDLRATKKGDIITRSTAISGTGNGDSFLRLSAARTASSIARYRRKTTLKQAINEITGPRGDLEKSAGDRWKKTGEGEGGMIGIESVLVKNSNGKTKATLSHVIDDYNCGGMFRAAVNDNGKAVFRVWRPGQYKELDEYPDEGKEYDLTEWNSEKSDMIYH